MGKPQVVYRETIQKTATATERFDREIGGSRHVAGLTVTVSPLERGEGNRVESKIDGELLPEGYETLILETLQQGLESGVLQGYPMIDVLVTLDDVEFTEGQSTDIAFRAAAAMVLNRACEQADPILLEPMMKLEVLVPEEFMGEVIGDLNSRNGRVEEIKPRGPVQAIMAVAPLSQMFGYSTALRSSTQGRGTFTMVFSHYDPVA